MELTHDWRSFRKTFFDERRVNPAKEAVSQGPIYIVVENEVLVSAFAEHEDFSDWIGHSFIEFLSQFHQRRIVTFERNALEGLMNQALSLPHFFEQIEFLRESGRPSVPIVPKGKSPLQLSKVKTTNKPLPMDYKKHFLIEGLRTWWARILPSTFGVLIRTVEEDREFSDFMLVVRNGKVDSYFKPDLTYLSGDRRQELLSVAKHLAEKHIFPVQGLLVNAEVWRRWMSQPDPWKEVFRSVRKQETRLVPFKFGVFSLLALRSFLRF